MPNNGLDNLCDPKYDAKGEIKNAKQEWETLIQEYKALEENSVADTRDAPNTSQTD